MRVARLKSYYKEWECPLEFCAAEATLASSSCHGILCMLPSAALRDTFPLISRSDYALSTVCFGTHGHSVLAEPCRQARHVVLFGYRPKSEKQRPPAPVQAEGRAWSPHRGWRLAMLAPGAPPPPPSSQAAKMMCLGLEAPRNSPNQTELGLSTIAEVTVDPPLEHPTRSLLAASTTGLAFSRVVPEACGKECNLRLPWERSPT